MTMIASPARVRAPMWKPRPNPRGTHVAPQARAMRKFLPLLVVCCAACGARTSLSQGVTDSMCHSSPPTCVQPSSNPCGAPTLASATCDEAAHEWVCPTGTRIYARATDSNLICRPFHGASTIDHVGPWGLSAMTELPTDDGRCLWIADSAKMSDGTMARNVAFEPDPTAPFGTCPLGSLSPPTPIVTMEGGDDPTILVQIDGGYRLGGTTRVLYRLFKLDSTAIFGATEMGGGIGKWDATTKRVVIPSPKDPFPWGLDLDLGDASIVLSSDASHAFVWGCAQPSKFLTQGCELARIDESDHVELFANSATWIPSVDASQGAVLFRSGTWNSSVVATASGLEHVYVADFGGMIQTDVASNVTGPWTPGADIGPCDLPSADPKAFCAGPTVHAAISDPTHPGELPITYGVGTTADTTTFDPTSANPDDYWPRLIWQK